MKAFNRQGEQITHDSEKADVFNIFFLFVSFSHKWLIVTGPLKQLFCFKAQVGS